MKKIIKWIPLLLILTSCMGSGDSFTGESPFYPSFPQDSELSQPSEAEDSKPTPPNTNSAFGEEEKDSRFDWSEIV